MNIQIDPEFKRLIVPLLPDEKELLTGNLKRDGCRDPLVIWAGKETLVDGHNRFSICNHYNIPYKTVEMVFEDRAAVEDWIITNQLGRRNLTPEAISSLRGTLFNRIKKTPQQVIALMSKLKSNDALRKSFVKDQAHEKLAEKFKVSARTIQGDGRFAKSLDALAEKFDEFKKNEILTREITIPKKDIIALAEMPNLKPAQMKAILAGKTLKSLKQEQKQLEQEEARVELLKTKPDLADRFALHCCDIAKAHEKIAAESVDWIITDPPYPQEFLPVYETLGKFALHALKPGGSAIIMIGQSYLPQIMEMLGHHLQYHWTLTYLTPGGQAVQLWDRKVNTFWKPLLWFTKGKYEGQWIGDVCKSDVNDNDKKHHHWGQSESGMSDIIQRMTAPGNVVCDPFCGGGTTGVVSVELDREFLGIDIDPECIKKTKDRLIGKGK